MTFYMLQNLEAEGVGNRKSTVISGRSNGGLLVGTSLVQNPNYFGATLPAVGVLDMLDLQNSQKVGVGVAIMEVRC